MNRIYFSLSILMGFLLITHSALAEQTRNVIFLEQAISRAQQNDPWLHGSQLNQKATEYRSDAANTWANPKVSLSMMNLPTNSWAFNQEAMTQFNIGVAQMFPRGDSLAIREAQLNIQASQFSFLREDRKAKLETLVSELWLDAYLAQQTIALIESDRALFEQMSEVARANYASTVGNTRQQDVIRADLEIIQLEDRLMVQQQALESAVAQLNEFLHIYSRNQSGEAFNFDSQPLAFSVSNTLPKIALNSQEITNMSTYKRSRMARALSQHPAVRALEVKRKVSEKAIDLAKQQYKPQWGVNANYGYRDDMPSGQSRADFFSVGVSFDVPLFTKKRQDKEVAASVADAEAVKTEKLLLTKKMLSAVEKEIKQLNRLRERQAIYEQQLLIQTHEQAEASLTAYTNDDGDFAEVVRARIAVLNARIASLQINVEALKTVSRINYFFSDSHNNTYRSDQGLTLQEGEK